MQKCHRTVPISIDDYCELKQISILKALNEHTCGECFETIKVGDEYIFETTLDDWLETHHTCEHCYSIRQVLFSNGWVYDRLLSDLSDFIYEVNGRIPEHSIKQLTPKARNMVLDEIESNWGIDKKLSKQ